MEIRISASKSVLFLFSVLGLLFVGSIAMDYIGLNTGHWQLGGLVKLFNLDGDETLPTWFNSFLLFLLCIATWTIARSGASRTPCLRRGWKFLSFLFLVMSIDEVATLHECLGRVFKTLWAAKGYFYFGFVIPGTVLAVALFVAYLPFLRALPRKLAFGMFGAGLIYVTGAAFVEALSANWYYLYGQKAAVYLLLANLEELLEMTGLILFLHVLLDYLRSAEPGHEPVWHIRLGP